MTGTAFQIPVINENKQAMAFVQSVLSLVTFATCLKHNWDGRGMPTTLGGADNPDPEIWSGIKSYKVILSYVW